MNNKEKMDFVLLIGGVCFMFIPWLMVIVSYFYVNNSKHKNRLVELGFGLNNKWIKGKRIGFVDSAMLFAAMPLNAKAIKLGRKIRGNKQPNHILFPNLNRDENYLKLWEEFRFYSLWTTSALCICVFGAFCLSDMVWIKAGFESNRYDH